MKSYLDELKEMYSNSEEIVIVFKDKQLLWTNKTNKFFNGQLPSYFEFLNDNFQQLPNVKFCYVCLNINNNTYNGTFVETVQDDGVYSTFIENVEDTVVCNNNVLKTRNDSQKYIENETFVQWLDIMGNALSIIITNATALIQQLEEEELINDSDVNNIVEYLRCILLFYDFGVLILNTREDSKEYSDKKLNNFLTFIPKMVSRINNDFNIDMEYDFKTKKLSQMSYMCNTKELKNLILCSLKYILLLSGSHKCTIFNNELSEEECEIIINASKNNVDFSLIKDMQKEMIKIVINRFCKHMGVIYNEKENDKTISLIFKFNISHNINKFESNFDDLQQSGMYSDYNIILHDYVK